MGPYIFVLRIVVSSLPIRIETPLVNWSFIVLWALVTGQPRRSIIGHGNWPVSFTRQSISDHRRRGRKSATASQIRTLSGDLGYLSLCRPCVVNQSLHSGVDHLLAGMADPLVSNYTLVIEHVERRRGGRVPFATDGAVVGKRSPVEFLLLHDFFQLFWFVRHDVDADQGERLLLQFRDERPLVGPMGPSRQSVLEPEIEQHDFAAIVT